MSYLKDREIWLSKVPTGNPPAGFFWKFIQNGKVVVRDSNGNNQIMVATNGNQAITGSLTVTGGITGTISSASYVQYSNVANKPALVSGSAQISEFGIFATTGSNGFNGDQAITGSLTVTGQVVAQTLNVQQVTSSIVYSSGSNIFGNDLGNTQQFTGSMLVTGSLSVNGAGTFTGTLNGTRAVFNSSFLSNETSKIGIGFESGYGLVNSWGANTSTYGGLKFQINASNGNTFNALTIAPSGFVGIGTNASLPYGRLEVADVSQLTNAGQWASATISMKQVSGVIGNYSQIVFGYHSNTQTNGSAYIGYVATNQGTNGYGDLVFGTRAVNTDTQPTERLRISSTGAANFFGKTSISKNHDDYAFTIVNTNTNGYGMYIQAGSTYNAIDVFNAAGTTQIFKLTGTGAATFGSSITLQSNNALFVNNADNTRSGYLRTSNEGTELSSHNGAGEPLILIAPHSSATMRFYTAGSTSVNERMRITSDGNVLIGTNTSNGALLEVKQPTLAIASIFQAWAPGVAGANFRVISTTGQPYMQYDFNNGKMGVNLSNTEATLATLGGAVQIMGDYRNHQTIIKSAGAAGTYTGQLTITIPQMSNASTDGFGGYSCEVYVSGFSGAFCHVWFSGYINGGITAGEATILRSSGGWSISQASFGANNQGFQFVIDYPGPFLVHPTARIIFNKGGSTTSFEYPANSITAVFS